jgi:MoaE-MoaD fusion protein
MVGLCRGLIDEAALLEAIDAPTAGAHLVFRGVARDNFDGRPVRQLAYEAYEPMALAALEAIATEVEGRWAGAKVAITHRLGVVPVGEAAVVIAVSTPHRADCYEANRYAIEELKHRVPIWKKEVYVDGSAWKANATAG